MNKPIRKAVLPVAGLGTRSLPATKVIPKEMLTVVDKPIIQFAVEEARAAGIEEFIFVTSRGKNVLEDHFDYHGELYNTLRSRGKDGELEAARKAELKTGTFCSVRQAEPLGLGHAVWCARLLIGDEPFAVLLPDELFLCRKPLLEQMVDVYDRLGGNLMAVSEVPRDLTARYGIIDVASDDGQVASVRGLVEKPQPGEAPSNLSIVGRYILQPEVLDHLDRWQTGKGGEIQLTDSVAAMIGRQPVCGMRFEGRRFDCGDKAEYVAANVAYSLANPAISGKVRDLVDDLLQIDTVLKPEAA
jgi:UTP--glucose-1-phosphate uridylyltransferase